MFFKKLKVKYKFVTILMLGVIGSLGMSGVWLSIYVEEYEVAYNQRQFEQIFSNIRNRLVSSKKDLATNAQSFSSDEDLVASVYLIDKYQNPNEYKEEIFDQEKKNLIDKLRSFMRATTNSSSIYLYTSDRNLIAYYDEKSSEQGFVTFVDNKRVLSKSSDDGASWGFYKIDEKSGLMRIESENEPMQDFKITSAGDLLIEQAMPVARQLYSGESRKVGFLYVTLQLQKEQLYSSLSDIKLDIDDKASLSKLLDAADEDGFIESIPSFFAAIEQHETNSTAILKGRLYSFKNLNTPSAQPVLLGLSLDYNLIHQRIEYIQYLLSALLLISALLIVPLAILVAQVYFTRPIEQLVAATENLRSGDYKTKIIVNTNDEFEILANAFNDAFYAIDKREQGYVELHSRLEEKVEERTRSLEKEVVEKQRAETLLLYSKTLLQLVIDTIPQYIFWKDRNGRYLGCNAHYARYLGYASYEAIEGKRDDELNIRSEQIPNRLELESSVIENGTPRVDDLNKVKTASGDVIYLKTSLVPLHDDIGVIGLLGTYEDVTQRIDFENKLIDAKEQAEQASQSKSEFLSRMSHELRTPLNAILGFGQLMEMEFTENENEDMKDWVGEMLHAGNHLLKLVNEILDLSQIESGKHILQLEALSLEVQIQSAIAKVNPMAKKRDISIHCEGEYPTVIADETRLTQVLLNLLSNAVKYNKEKGSITIASSSDAGRVTVSVTDTGCGISSSDLKKLFSPFERLDKVYSGIEGTGIGLALTKRLVESMSGEIGVESTPGDGSTFWFSLPIAEA